MKKYNRFDLEQAILDSWKITDDLKIFLDKYEELSEDSQLNILIGMNELSELRFQKLWEIFEELVHSGVMHKNV